MINPSVVVVCRQKHVFMPKPQPTRTMAMTETEIQREKRESLVAAFGAGGFARHSCHCGREYYNCAHDSLIDWEEGEEEELERGKAIGLNHFVSTVSFGGKVYVTDCTCWHKPARRYMAFLDRNAFKIATYFLEEKKRKERDAKQAPLVEVP